VLFRSVPPRALRRPDTKMQDRLPMVCPRRCWRSSALFEPCAQQCGAVTVSVLRHQVVEAFDFVIGQSKPHVKRRGFISTRQSSHSERFTSFAVPFNETRLFILLTRSGRKGRTLDFMGDKSKIWGVRSNVWSHGFTRGTARQAARATRLHVSRAENPQRTVRSHHFAVEKRPFEGAKWGVLYVESAPSVENILGFSYGLHKWKKRFKCS